MQSSWGPRIFWLVVFVLAGLGIYAFFYEPNDEPRMGYSQGLSNMVHIGPTLGGLQIQLGRPGDEPREWKGDIKLAKGKILQFYPLNADPNSVFSSTRFECWPDQRRNTKQPVVLHVVYQAEKEDTLQLKLGDETQKIVLETVTAGKPSQEYWAGTVRVRGETPVQMYENEGASEDHHPVLTRDVHGVDYLLYMNSERSKGIDVNGVLAGSFETLENPITSTTLRLSRFHNGAWQYSEAITPKLESCLNPVIAKDTGGTMYAAWLQKSTAGWDIYYQSKDYGPTGESPLSWSKPTKLTPVSGYHQQLVAATDARGKVWLAWQTWYQDHCEIFAAVINDDKHFMKTPGPIAVHPREDDGRWFPSLAPDKLGNMYLAWSVFRQGHFVLEVMKLHENMLKSKPISLASSTRHSMRPSVVCDGENHLWIAYEESEPSTSFGDFRQPASRIRVRVLRADGSLDEYPQIAAPPHRGKSDPTVPSTQEVRCIHPCMMVNPQGQPVVAFQAEHAMYVAYLSDSGWSEPRSISQTHAEVQPNGQAIYQNGHVVGVQENLDWRGRMRLQFAAEGHPDASVKIGRKPALAPGDKSLPAWKPFTELARQFRKRSDDSILNKRYLLRGLVVLPGAVNQFTSDPWEMMSISLEQSFYDWMLIPQNPNSPIVEQWYTAQMTQAYSMQEDRNLVLGYYRPMVGERAPLLLLDTMKDKQPLPPLTDFESLRKAADKANRLSVTQEVDRGMIGQFLSQRQHVGLTMTDDWRSLAAMTKPGSNTAYESSIERLLLPLWYPEQTPLRPMPAALRVVTYANGKSNDHLMDALRDRHYYVATDDIYLLANCARYLPGDGFQTSFRPAISVTVQGTGKLKYVEIWQDNKLVKSEEPPGAAALLEYVSDKDDGQWHSYTVRVVQENGAEAIAQPFWVRYIP